MDALCIDTDEKCSTIVMGLRSKSIVIFDIEVEEDYFIDLKEIEMPIHKNRVNKIKISGDGHIGLSGGLDYFIVLWNAKSKQVLS